MYTNVNKDNMHDINTKPLNTTVVEIQMIIYVMAPLQVDLTGCRNSKPENGVDPNL